MHDPQTEFLLAWEVVAVPVKEFVVVRQVANWLVGFDVDGGGLSNGDASEGFDLAGKVVSGGTKCGKAHASGVNG